MGKYQQQPFVEAFELAGPADKPCIGQLITGEESLHGLLMYSPERPPHSPPADQHATLWLDEDGEPALYGIALTATRAVLVRM